MFRVWSSVARSSRADAPLLQAARGEQARPRVFYPRPQEEEKTGAGYKINLSTCKQQATNV